MLCNVWNLKTRPHATKIARALAAKTSSLQVVSLLRIAILTQFVRIGPKQIFIPASSVHRAVIHLPEFRVAVDRKINLLVACCNVFRTEFILHRQAIFRSEVGGQALVEVSAVRSTYTAQYLRKKGDQMKSRKDSSRSLHNQVVVLLLFSSHLPIVPQPLLLLLLLSSH